ncbi:ABC transporter ATP-binding protein [Parafilimonas sp.]|uniref:ABC transporter ATP-binding protein n=1 Tax=Parafilimonas sp. TaxID=1969739 RepID=UPI0039E3FD3E
MNDQPKFILYVEGLHIYYEAFHAVKNVSFHVKPGEIFGLLGPNGAGKTSTLSAIEGLIQPQSGNINVAGYNIKDKPLYAKASMGVQLQSTNFQPELTVTEILQLFAGIYGINLTKEALEKILTENNLQESGDKRFGQLSGGQQQRVSLSLCVLHNPRLLLLDEPTTGLDPQSRRQLWERMEAMRENGHGILLTTHSMEEAEAVCDRIAIIDHGQIIAIDAPQTLIDKHRNDPEVIAVSRKGKITLEDVFIGLTGRAVRA